MNYDVQLLSGLPAVFQGVQYLEFKEGPDRMTSQGRQMNPHLFSIILQNWANVERIVDSSARKNVSTRFLESIQFIHLKHLELRCINPQEDISPLQRYERAQALVNNIHNAPSLEKLLFAYGSLKINDLEIVHDKLPNLAYLELENNILYHGEAVDRQAIQPARSLSCLIVNGVPNVRLFIDGRTVFNNTSVVRLSEWMDYFGAKYSHLQELVLKFGLYNNEDLLIREKEAFTTSAAKALESMSRLKVCSLDMCVDWRRLLHALDGNSLQLQHVGILTNGTDSAETTVLPIRSAQSTNLITSLDMTCTASVDTLPLMRHIANMRANFKTW